MNEPLLTAKQLAARLNVSESWAYQYQGPGRVHVGRAIRFDYPVVLAHLSHVAEAEAS